MIEKERTNQRCKLLKTYLDTHVCRFFILEKNPYRCALLIVVTYIAVSRWWQIVEYEVQQYGVSSLFFIKKQLYLHRVSTCACRLNYVGWKYAAFNTKTGDRTPYQTYQKVTFTSIVAIENSDRLSRYWNYSSTPTYFPYRW